MVYNNTLILGCKDQKLDKPLKDDAVLKFKT